MEIQLLILNFIILLGMLGIIAILLMKAIIYHNEIKTAQIDSQKRITELAHEEARMKLEKSNVDYENTKLLLEYAKFMKSNGQDLPPGYHAKVDETFKEIEKEK